MIHVYVIESISDGTWDTGMAINEANRLKEHNAGKNRFTKGHRPWKIIYTETQLDWATARIRGKYLKSAGGKFFYKNGCIIKEESRVPCPRDAVRQGFPYALQEKVKLKFPDTEKFSGFFIL